MKAFNFLVLIFVQDFGLSLGEVRSDCVCGESNTKTSGRIVNGKITTPHKYPWMAAMFLATSSSFMCGGAIISDKNILTAGHCLFYIPDPYKTYWMLGMYDRSRQDGRKYHVAHYQFHPKFINYTVYDDYDMSIVRLGERIIFDFTMRPICLPQPDDAFTGLWAVVAGWGRIAEGAGAKLASVLLETKIKVYRNDECKHKVKRLVEFNPKSMICGYENKKDACQGDSGGPFFIETHPNRYEVFGVVSFGDGCAREFPGIYGKVSNRETLNWIGRYIATSQSDTCSDSIY
ncbi:CLUMA_CG018141, isoform A [Clunio marinus]|uniref:CLUMA_CG018141, isoform A n=1 Tax=Clunio marinus TaxID=568069 RepID=A0A1J1IYV4_9DIPT|nr:CLUMA_CG018141, isoform A [Clunio marinus]